MAHCHISSPLAYIGLKICMLGAKRPTLRGERNFIYALEKEAAVNTTEGGSRAKCVLSNIVRSQGAPYRCCFLQASMPHVEVPRSAVTEISLYFNKQMCTILGFRGAVVCVFCYKQMCNMLRSRGAL